MPAAAAVEILLISKGARISRQVKYRKAHDLLCSTINMLTPIVLGILEELQKRTGWAFSMVMGGLNERGFRESYRYAANGFST